MITSSSTVDRVFSPFEVACLDVQGQAAGRPVSDLLGGAVRDAVPFSAYLFYKWAAHPGGEPDDWGAALDPDAIVAQARRIIDEYGFTAIKLKGGVFPPEEEMAAIEALRAAFPGHPLRLDPNAAWTPQTSIKVASGLAGVLEYLEDPTPDLDGMAEVARQAPMPLATNMCVVAFNQLAPGDRETVCPRGAFRSPLLGRPAAIAVAGRHLRQLRTWACRCTPTRTSGSASPPWCIWRRRRRTSRTRATPIGRGRPRRSSSRARIEFVDGSVPVPTTAGLGVQIDEDNLAALHEQYLRCGIRDRDDTGYMRSIDPAYEAISPRW